MIAVDVVLLPPAELADKAIEMNGQLVKAGSSDIVLDSEKCLPHITLAMGCIKEDDMQKADSILAEISGSFAPVKLKTISSRGGKAWIQIEKTRDIELLHEIVMIRLSPLFTHKVSENMVSRYQEEEISEVTFEYIKKFPTASSFENFVPHITVGTEDMNIPLESMEFTSETIALCHLGSYCTCRKVLLSHSLYGKGQ